MADTEKPRVFTRTRERDGKTLQRLAHSPAEVVKFTFDGWQEITGADAAKAIAAADRETKAAEKAAADTAKPDTTAKK
jgi:hypothetical protein